MSWRTREAGGEETARNKIHQTKLPLPLIHHRARNLDSSQDAIVAHKTRGFLLDSWKADSLNLWKISSRHVSLSRWPVSHVSQELSSQDSVQTLQTGQLESQSQVQSYINADGLMDSWLELQMSPKAPVLGPFGWWSTVGVRSLEACPQGIQPCCLSFPFLYQTPTLMNYAAVDPKHSSQTTMG